MTISELIETLMKLQADYGADTPVLLSCRQSKTEFQCYDDFKVYEFWNADDEDTGTIEIIIESY